MINYTHTKYIEIGVHMDQYAVFGNPIKHSKSPFIHTLFANQTQQQMTYGIVEAPVDSFKESVQAFFEQGAKGCNITAPFKEEAFKFAQSLTDRARLAGAVNTLKKTDDGLIIGDNTDGAGLVQDLKNNHVDLTDARILLLGAGGAARGVCSSLLAEKPAQLIIANRTVEKAQTLASIFQDLGHVEASGFEQLTGPFDVIINSTSAGLHGSLPNISSALITPETAIYDMTYNTEVTAFNAWAKESGARLTIDGLGMLVGQAAESFAIWRGVKPGAKQILNELRHNLAG